MSIEEICDKNGIENYTINDDGSIDVDGNVFMNGFDMYELPLKFNNVTGGFNCNDNNLTTLKGCPEKVGSEFHAGSNKLTEVDFCPKECRVVSFSTNYDLVSIKKFPEKCIRVDFSWTNLLSLKGLENVEGLEEVYVANSPLVSIFGGRIKDINMIRHFISFKVVDGGTINLKRLQYFQSIYTEILLREVSLKAWYKLE